MKRVLKTKTFNRWLHKSALDDASLCAAVDEMEHGLMDADLGNGLFKKRIAIGNKGKSAGARTLIASNLGNRWFFIYGFAKSQKANITEKQTAALKSVTSELLALTDNQINALLNIELWEICDEK